MRNRTLLKNGWTTGHFVGAAVLAVLGVLATKDAWLDMLSFGLKDEESSHMFLVPIVAAWLVWVRRERMRLCKPRGTWLGPLLVAAGWAISSAGYAMRGQAFWHGGAVVLVIGCVLTVLGSDVLRRFVPAFAVLVFLVPVPGSIREELVPLQAVTARATQAAAEMLGMYIERRGHVLAINGIDVAVAEACNGLRMVFALVLVSYAFAFSIPLRPYVRTLILLGSPVSAILCNVIRLIPTVWIYGHYSNDIAKRFHDMAGLVMLPVAFLLLMGLLRLLRWALVPVRQYTLAYDY